MERTQKDGMSTELGLMHMSVDGSLANRCLQIAVTLWALILATFATGTPPGSLASTAGITLGVMGGLTLLIRSRRHANSPGAG